MESDRLVNLILEEENTNEKIVTEASNAWRK